MNILISHTKNARFHTGHFTVTASRILLAMGRAQMVPQVFAKLHPKHKTPYVTHLCPGACFGYFQTQWNRWEDVCPLPYQGVGLTDAPRPAPGAITPVPKPGSDPKMIPPSIPGSDAPLPRPAPLPMKPPGTGSPLPTIPNAPMPGGAADPKGKFVR